MCYWHASKESSSHGFIVLISAENNGYFERLFRKLFIIPNSIKDETPQPTLFNNNLLILKQIELKKLSLECINDKFKCFFYHCSTIYINFVSRCINLDFAYFLSFTWICQVKEVDLDTAIKCLARNYKIFKDSGSGLEPVILSIGDRMDGMTKMIERRAGNAMCSFWKKSLF